MYSQLIHLKLNMPSLLFQQGRLLPHLAATYAMKLFSESFFDQLMHFNIEMMMKENEDLLASQGMEIHALSSATKPLCAWTARDAIQDCRESCGEHGYLKGKFQQY